MTKQTIRDYLCDWSGCVAPAEQKHVLGNLYCAKHFAWRVKDDAKDVTPEPQSYWPVTP